MKDISSQFYLSTRDKSSQRYFFDDVLLGGICSDGGLYVPGHSLPRLACSWRDDFRDYSYEDFAEYILGLFLPSIFEGKSLKRMVSRAYSRFDVREICPLVRLDDRNYILEQYHGPTLAFKDFALQFLSELICHRLSVKGKRCVILVATSGDTGSAAIDAFKEKPLIDVFVFFPKGRISEMQRLQMTTTGSDNIHPVCVEGTFDDCQQIVKHLFRSSFLAGDYILCGVNSINWFRLVSQLIYYLYALLRIDCPASQVTFCVPTGNFGNVLSGYYARLVSGLNYRLMIVTNSNDILYRSWLFGSYECFDVKPTFSPSMDIQISSNFERLLYHLSDNDCELVSDLMFDLSQKRKFVLPPDLLARYRVEFLCSRVNESEAQTTMMQIWQNHKYMLDPHSAIGLTAALKAAKTDNQSKFVTLATAHAAKFPEAVKKATGYLPKLPPQLEKTLKKKEIYQNSTANLEQIQNIINNCLD